MEVTENAIIEALSGVQDPESKQNVIEAKLVSNLSFDDKKITFDLQLNSPALHHKERMVAACEFALERAFGKEMVFEITTKVTEQKTDNGLPGVKNVIAIASGKGGVGKSTVTANLAMGLHARGFNVAIVDADIYGPSMPTMFNVLHDRPQGLENNKMTPVDAYGIQLMSLGFFAEPHQPIVWRGAMVNKALKQMFFDTVWEDVDYLLVDLPPGTGDIHLSLVQSLPVSAAIMVTTPQDVAIADVIKGAEMFRLPKVNVPLLGVIENMSWFTPEELPDNRYYIFGKDGGKHLAEKLSIPLIGQLPLIQGVRESGDAGRPAIMQENTLVVSFLNKIVDEVVTLHKQRLSDLPDTQKVTMTK